MSGHSYDLIARLGRGGMGVVDLARDEAGKKVALKRLTLHGSAAEIARARQRLLREAEVLRKLHHPNIVRLLDVVHQQEEEWAPAFTAARRRLVVEVGPDVRVLATPGALAQVVATLGYGAWFPWAVPSLLSGTGGPGAGAVGVAGLLSVLVVGVASGAATVLWWERADHA